MAAHVLGLWLLTSVTRGSSWWGRAVVFARRTESGPGLSLNASVRREEMKTVSCDAAAIAVVYVS